MLKPVYDIGENTSSILILGNEKSVFTCLLIICKYYLYLFLYLVYLAETKNINY